jgi:hypothetical protein
MHAISANAVPYAGRNDGHELPTVADLLEEANHYVSGEARDERNYFSSGDPFPLAARSAEGATSA